MFFQGVRDDLGGVTFFKKGQYPVHWTITRQPPCTMFGMCRFNSPHSPALHRVPKVPLA